MAGKGGTMTLSDFIQKDAEKFGELIAHQYEIALDANERLKKSALELGPIMDAFRKSESNYKLVENKGREKNEIDKITQGLKDQALAIKEITEERKKQIAAEKLAAQISTARQKTSSKKAIDDETLSHKKLINSIKEEEQIEKSLQRTKQETIKTEKAAADLATKIIAQESETLRLMSQEEALKQKQITTEREETKLLRELEQLEQKRLGTQKSEISLLQQEERLKRERLETIRTESRLTEQEQRIVKNTLDIKAKELNISRQEEAARKRNTVLTVEEKVQNEQLNKVKKQQARETLGLVGPYEKLNRQRREAQLRLADLLAAEQRNTREIVIAQREYDVLNKRVKDVDKAVDIFQKNIGNYKSAFDGLGGALTALVGAFGVATGVNLFSDAVSNSFAIIRDYEAEIVNLAAIAGNTREEIKPLEDEIQAVAAASINSATEVAQLATELIKLGSTPDEAEKLLKPVNDLSLALRASAEDSATLVKSLLNAYQEGADQAVRFTDVLAESANRSALDFEGLRDAFSYLAPTANTLNFSIEKTAAILGILADNGIKAESAGRLTSTALLKLAGNGISLEEALIRINKAQADGVDELGQLAIAGDLFGAEAAKIGIILAQNTEKIDINTKAYENSGGALESLTNKQLKSLDAQLKILDSSLEDYILKTDESTGASKSFANLAGFLARNLDTIIDTCLAAVAAFVVYKTTMLAASVATKIQTASIYAQIIAQAAMQRGIAGVRAELSALSAATKINPYALIITAMIGLVFYLSTLKKSLAETAAETKRSTDEFLKGNEVHKKNISSIEQMADRYDELKKKTILTAEEQKELNEITAALGRTVPEATKKINEYGDALAVNTDKIREYTGAQREVAELQARVELDKNVELANKLFKEQSRFESATRQQRTMNTTFIESLSDEYRTLNGQLQVRAGFLNQFRNLTTEELLQFKQQKLKIDQEQQATQKRITQLRILLGLEKAVNTEKTGGGGDGKDGKQVVAKLRTIEVIDAEIQAEEDKIDQLTLSTKAEGILIDKRIATLRKERDAIYQTNKSRKDYAKIREEELAKLRKIDDDAYNLAIFRLNRIKAYNDEVLEDENATEQELIDAALSNESVLTAIAEETAEKRLKEISRYNDKVRDLTDEEIATLIAGGKIKKTLTNDEILVVEQLAAERENIFKGSEKRIDKIQLSSFEKRLNEQLRLNNIAVNNDLIAENERFNNEEINNANRERKLEEHEKNIAEIKKKYAIQALQDQIKALEALLATETVNAEKRREIETNISNYKKELSDITLANQTAASKSYLDLLLGEELSEQAKKERLVDLSKQLKDELVNLANAIFDARIQKIDDEIAANEEYYSRQIELAGDDQRQRDLLEQEAEKKRKELERKKREEQRKQAIFNKALKIVDIAGATALGIMQAYAQLGPILGNVGAAIVSAIGALQLAAVIATPIPKYKGGRTGGPSETAVVGDGGVSEVIEDKHGRIRYTPATPTIVKLNEGDSVHSSHEAYMQYKRTQLIGEAARETERLQRYQTVVKIDNNNDNLSEIIEDSIKKGFKNASVHVHNAPAKIDIAHLFWAQKNINW